MLCRRLLCVFFFFSLQVKSKLKRVKTIYDGLADNEDELTFAEGEVIIVTGEEDQEWWVSGQNSSSGRAFQRQNRSCI